MSAKVIFFLCAVVQSVFSQCTSRAAVDATGYGTPYAWSAPGLAYDGFAAPALAYDGLAAPALAYNGLGVAGRGLACDGLYPAIASNLEFTPTSGGALPVTSASPVPPTGISVVSENAYEGALAVAGELPFVGTTALEGVVPSAGEGAINHACGNGVTAMESDTTAFAPELAIAPATAITPLGAAIAPAAASFGPVSPLSPAGRFPQAAGLGFGDRFGYRGCGNRGVVY